MELCFRGIIWQFPNGMQCRRRALAMEHASFRSVNYYLLWFLRPGSLTLGNWECPSSAAQLFGADESFTRTAFILPAIFGINLRRLKSRDFSYFLKISQYQVRKWNSVTTPQTFTVGIEGNSQSWVDCIKQWTWYSAFISLRESEAKENAK